MLTIGPRLSRLASAVFPYIAVLVCCGCLHYYEVLSYLGFPQIVEGRRRKVLLVLPRRRLLTDAQQVTDWVRLLKSGDVPGPESGLPWALTGLATVLTGSDRTCQAVTSCFAWYLSEFFFHIFRYFIVCALRYSNW